MDEIMRGMQGTHGEAAFARLRSLPVWVGVGVVVPSRIERRNLEYRTRLGGNRTKCKLKEELQWLE